jgi:hypothetical protein
MAGHMGVKGVYYKLGIRNAKGSVVGPRWKPEAERACFSLLGALKIYGNLLEGEKEEILSQ